MKIFLACGTSACNKEEKENFFKENKPLYLLETFYSGEKICKEVIDIVGVDNFLLDSGAFTFMNNFKGKVNWDKYVEDYANFINKYNIKYFFELDIDVLVGIKEVERLRDKLEKLTNKQCIPVWHKLRGIEYWKKMVKDYSYIAIGGIVVKEIKNKEFYLIKKMIDYACTKNVKVHGLGFTKTKELKNYNFYSVDSSSWLSSASRGQKLSYFNGKYMENKDINKGVKKANIIKLSGFNFKEWIKFQEYADKYL